MRRLQRVLAFVFIATLAGAAPDVRADTAKILDSADEAAGARVELIRGAGRTIDALYYTVGDDSVSLAVLALLRDAARRGVLVRLVVDGHFNNIPDDIEALLSREGMQIREYHPFRPWRPTWWTRRLHDKLLIADGTRMITGGRNIESPYFGRGVEVGRRNYLDRDVFVEGEAAARAETYFDLLWNGRKVAKTDIARFRKKRLERRCDLLPDQPGRERCERLRAEVLDDLEKASRLLDAHRSLVDTDPLFAPAPDGGPAAKAREVGSVEFLHDPATGKRSGAGVASALMQILDSARESVIIESPYLVPSLAVERSLRTAVSRNVRVRVLTNALTASDNMLAQAGYSHAKGDIANWGLELWEFPGPDCMHAKSIVVDGRLTIVGSFNLDPRSESLNTEVAVVIDDATIAGEVLAVMDARVAQSFRIGQDGRPVPGPVVPPTASPGKRANLRLLELIAPFIREQI